jgi:hypothetical protein
MRFALLAAVAFLAALPSAAQDVKSLLEAQGLEIGDTKTFQDVEAFVARVKGAKDPAAAQERIVVISAGKKAWESTDKDVAPASRIEIKSIGRDLNGDGHPDLLFSAFSGGAHCCLTYYVYSLKPKFARIATFASGNSGATGFIDIPGRKKPVVFSADDISAYSFTNYAGSVFPMVVLEVGDKGHFSFAPDLMKPKLPGMPPPVCTMPGLKLESFQQRVCDEYATAKRRDRVAKIKAQLADIKVGRDYGKVPWDDYWKTGMMAEMAGELDRYAYTGYGTAGFGWLDSVWPGNDAVKARFVAMYNENKAKSQFVEDLKALGLYAPKP